MKMSSKIDSASDDKINETQICPSQLGLDLNISTYFSFHILYCILVVPGESAYCSFK